LKRIERSYRVLIAKMVSTDVGDLVLECFAKRHENSYFFDANRKTMSIADDEAQDLEQ
jgi:hypothetical protein